MEFLGFLGKNDLIVFSYKPMYIYEGLK